MKASCQGSVPVGLLVGNVAKAPDKIVTSLQIRQGREANLWRLGCIHRATDTTIFLPSRSDDLTLEGDSLGSGGCAEKPADMLEAG